MAEWQRWPGFCPDKAERWAAAKRADVTIRKSKSFSPRVTAERDPTYPSAIAKRETSPDFLAKRAIGERKLTRGQQRHREALADGDLATKSYNILAMATRFVPGGRDSVIAIIKRASLNGDKDATAWRAVYEDLREGQQHRVSLDDVCEAAGVQPDILMGVIVSTATRWGMDMADLTAATMHPLIVHQTAKSAMRIGGDYADVAQKDREFMLQHGKFIATPKGTEIRINASAQAAAAASSQPSVPTFAESLDVASEAQRDVQGELAAAPLDAELA